MRTAESASTTTPTKSISTALNGATPPDQAVTLSQIQKPEARLRRLNQELTKAQEAMLSSSDRIERKRLRRKCRELDLRLGNPPRPTCNAEHHPCVHSVR